MDFSYLLPRFKNDHFPCEFFLKRWIITAAHCFPGIEPVDVYFGISSDGTYKASMEVQPSDQYIFPEYYREARLNDIGVYSLII